MEATTPYWERQGYQTRVTQWYWRLRPFVQEKCKDQCGTCQMNGRCNRIPLDKKITATILAGEECPDHKSVWKGILGKEEKYDWGF